MRTLMFPLASNPSSWFTISNIVRCTSLSPPTPSSKRAPPIASTSSKKTMHAFFERAIYNRGIRFRNMLNRKNWMNLYGFAALDIPGTVPWPSEHLLRHTSELAHFQLHGWNKHQSDLLQLLQEEFCQYQVDHSKGRLLEGQYQAWQTFLGEA